MPRRYNITLWSPLRSPYACLVYPFLNSSPALYFK